LEAFYSGAKKCQAVLVAAVRVPAKIRGGQTGFAAAKRTGPKNDALRTAGGRIKPRPPDERPDESAHKTGGRENRFQEGRVKRTQRRKKANEKRGRVNRRSGIMGKTVFPVGDDIVQINVRSR